ncbi:unnamed protein product, partial [Allacma fusca]
VRILAYQGGRNHKEATERALKELLTFELASNYNWVGKKCKNRDSKRPFSISIFPDIVSRAVLLTVDGSTKAEIEEVIKVWLRNAPAKITV